jgi:hypothetical protein
MFDTINIYDNKYYNPNLKPKEVLPNLLDVKHVEDGEWGDYYTGKYLNYNIQVNDFSIKLTGSLSKYWFEGDNINTLTRRDTERSIEKLCDDLHANLRPAKVIRMDYGTNILTKCPPSEYISLLGTKKNFIRILNNPDTLYYRNAKSSNTKQRTYKKNMELIIYDKKKDALAKGMFIHDILKNSNRLRFEVRLLRQVNKWLKTDVTLGILYQEQFYETVYKRLYEEYKSIQKLKKHEYMINDIATVRDAEEAYFAYLLQKEGQQGVDEYMNYLKANNIYGNRQRYYDLQKKLNERLSAKTKSEKNELILELDKTISNNCRYAR